MLTALVVVVWIVGVVGRHLHVLRRHVWIVALRWLHVGVISRWLAHGNLLTRLLHWLVVVIVRIVAEIGEREDNKASDKEYTLRTKWMIYTYAGC